MFNCGEVMCRNCGNEMRLNSIEPGHGATRAEFRCNCGHIWGFDMPRRDMSAKARGERVAARIKLAL